MERPHSGRVAPLGSQTPRERFTVLLEQNRDMALVYINSYISDLFANADTALLDFAEQAENNAIQARFYEAMGALRERKDEMELWFRQEIKDGFDHFGHSEPADWDNASEEFTDGIELALIGHDEAEESVAAENLIGRAKSDYYPELYALGRRLAVLNDGRKVDDAEIPAGPTQLVRAYQQALQCLDIDIKVKLVFYALLDRLVMRQLKPLYDEFNDNLKQAGILPNLKPVIRKEDERASATPEGREDERGERSEPRTPGEEIGQTQTGTADASLGEDLFQSILELMSRRHRRSGRSVADILPGTAAASTPEIGAGPAQDTRPGDSGAHTPANPTAARQRAISAIDHIAPPSLAQSGIMADAEGLPNVEIDPEFLGRVKQALAAEREQVFAEVSREEMSGIDADTIDLIGMLFEYMLNDPLLPNLAKALLSHLHTPYLKLTLLDRRLLTDNQHPARLLLDILVEAGGQWVHENDPKRGIYPQMQAVVERILKEFADDPSLFEEILDEFRAAVEEHKRRTEAIEERSQESIKGRERLHVAKRRVIADIQAHIGHAPLPEPIRKFLTEIWADRLVFILLRDPQGEASDEWRQAIEVTERLVSLFRRQGPDIGQTRSECRRLRTVLETALEALGGYHQPAARETLRLLGHPEEVLTWRTHITTTPGEETQPLFAEAASDARPSSQTIFTDEPTVVIEALPPEERKIIERLKKLKFGTWFEFRSADTPPVRLKLSWLSPLTSTCMFVDRSGIQARIKPLAELAHELATGQAKLIPKPSHPFVERTLLTIRKALRKALGEPKDAHVPPLDRREGTQEP